MKQTNYTQKELQIIEGFFTDDEWNAIEYALEDYQDYGDNEAKLASQICLLYTSPSPRDLDLSRMPSAA